MKISQVCSERPEAVLVDIHRPNLRFERCIAPSEKADVAGTPFIVSDWCV
jgi:hypothetical protein